MILVVGATGLLGGQIALKLLAQGKNVRVLLRRNSPAVELATQGRATAPLQLMAAGAEAVYGDLTDYGSLCNAVSGVETVISTANSISRDNETIDEVDLNGTRRLIDAAETSGVHHFIYVSGAGRAMDNPNPLMVAKAVCEAHLKESGLEYTTLNPGMFLEVWVGLVVGIPLQAGQPVTLVNQGDRKQLFVSMADVAEYALCAVDDRKALNQEILIGGPEPYSWTEIVHAVGEIIGRPVPINYVPAGDPVPLLPAEIGLLLTAFEMFDSFVDTSATAAAYNVQQTPVKAVLEQMFG
jgi:uncharacterized protein YbjT (DUF2867 family)